MRKDVERLSDNYSWGDAEIGSDLYALGWPEKPYELAARYAILLSPVDFSYYSKDEPLRLLDVAGRYLITDVVASGPAMFDTARLERAGGVLGSDRDPPAPLGPELGHLA